MQFVQVFPASFLLIAAGLKIHQLSSMPLTENLIFNSRWAATVLVVFEIMLAFWLFSAWLSKHSKGVGLVMFSLFLLVSFYKLLSGADSCGCFGVVEIHPIFTCLIDLVSLTLLYYWTPKGSIHPVTMFVAALFAIGAGLGTISQLKTTHLYESEFNGDGIVILEPDNWIGKRLPVRNHIQGDWNPDGDWRVIFYHEDCPKCQSLIANASAGPLDKAVVFVEIPPYKSPKRIDNGKLKWRQLWQNKGDAAH